MVILFFNIWYIFDITIVNNYSYTYPFCDLAYDRHSMMGCSIEADPNLTEARTDVGLVKGHAYSITKVVKAQIETPQASGEIPLIRIRNPWGNEAEWNGAWSDR